LRTNVLWFLKWLVNKVTKISFHSFIRRRIFLIAARQSRAGVS
jgi:hypothetical protein